MQRHYSLHRFPRDGGFPSLRMDGNVIREAETLSVDDHLSGELRQLSIATPEGPPRRRDRLWQQTCFELFITAADQPAYREFNLSPAGDWNCYRFSSYRAGMAPETALTVLPFEVRSGANALRMQLSLDLSVLLPPDSPVDLGISAVIQESDRTLSYWALHHPNTEPDFHHRDGFTLHMAP